MWDVLWYMRMFVVCIEVGYLFYFGDVEWFVDLVFCDMVVEVVVVVV